MDTNTSLGIVIAAAYIFMGLVLAFAAVSRWFDRNVSDIHEDTGCATIAVLPVLVVLISIFWLPLVLGTWLAQAGKDDND